MSTTNTLTTFLKLSPYLAGGSYPYPVVQQDWLPTSVSYGTNSGTANGMIDQLYQAQVTATTSGASITLRNGTSSTLTNAIGELLSFARVDSWSLFNTGTVTVTVTGTFTNGAYGTNGISLGSGSNGGQFAHAMGTNSSGLSVSTGTNGTLTFTGSGGTAGVLVMIAGRSA